jgi:hypothetical protein
MSKRVEAGLKLSEQQVTEIVEDLLKRFRGVPERCVANRADLFCLPERDPIMPDHMKDVIPWQWDGPRQIWVKLRARLTENHYIARAEPAKPTASWREKASRLESVFNDGLAYAEERDGVDIQGYLSDGQIIDGCAYLHWCKADHLWPVADDYLESDDVDDGMEWDEEKGKYRETDAAYQSRRRHAIARAGYPWFIEVIPRANVAYYRDKKLANGLGMVMVSREVGTMAYFAALSEEEEDAARKDLGIGGEGNAPGEDEPSRSDWGEVMTVHQLWTRYECYEIAVGGGKNWRLMRGFKHPYEMPPFAKVSGDEVLTDDPLLCDLPALEGMFKAKPAFDRLMTLYLALAEQIALPLFYWRNVESGAPLLGEDGNIVALSKNSLASYKAPTGYTLEKLEYQMNPAFVSGVTMMRDLAREAQPSTGEAEVNQNTDPWAIRLQQAQENVVPASYVKKVAKGITTMLRNKAMVMAKPAEQGGYGEPVAVYARVRGGAIDRTTTVYVEPEDIGSLDITGAIGSTSAQERISKVEHGKGLLKDGVIDWIEFYESYYEAEDPDAMNKRRHAMNIVEEYLPPLLKQELAKRYGTRITLGPNGELMGPGGVVVDPMQMLQSQGIQLGPAGAAAPTPGGPAPGSVMQSGPGDLAPLASPSGQVTSLPGMPQ